VRRNGAARTPESKSGADWKRFCGQAICQRGEVLDRTREFTVWMSTFSPRIHVMTISMIHFKKTAGCVLRLLLVA
jgi:hypothetical protein